MSHGVHQPMATEAKTQTAALAAAKRKEFTRSVIELAGMLPVLVVICILFAILTPNFLTQNNLVNVVRQASINIVLAAGMTFVILTGSSLSIFSALCILIIFWAKQFDTILSFTIFLDCFGMVFSAGSIFIIRKRTAHLNDSGIFMMKLYPLLPLIFIAAYTFVGISIAADYRNNHYAALTGLSVLAGFMVIYFIVKAFAKK